MKKALIVANLGGFVEFLFNDIEILRNMGYSVTYASNVEASNWDVYKNRLIEMNVPIKHICFNSKKVFSKDNIIAYKQLKNLLKEDFDLIHCHTPITGCLTRLATKKYRKRNAKVIYTSHGFNFNKNSSKKSWLIYYNIEKAMAKLCDAIITINKEDYEIAKTLKCKNVFHINGVGVELKKYSNVKIDKIEYLKKLGIESNKTIILSIGELSKRKNHEVVIEAISQLPNKNDYVYIICGKGICGGTEEELLSKAKKLNVNLKLLGFRTDIPQIIHCSDIGVLPSIREGLGLAGIQTLAGGVPLIASNVQGIKDYVIDGKNGYLCNAHNPSEFREKIKILSDTKLRNKMAKNCGESVKKFDMSISERQRKEIYEKVLNIL